MIPNVKMELSCYTAQHVMALVGGPHTMVELVLLIYFP